MRSRRTARPAQGDPGPAPASADYVERIALAAREFGFPDWMRHIEANADGAP